jgi:hypothetical protein
MLARARLAALAALTLGAVFLLAPAAAAQCRTDKPLAEAPQQYARFGASVAISGDRMVVGSTFYAVGNSTPGAVYIYQRSSSGWALQKTLLAADGQDFDDFGISVAIDGDTLLVGADSTDGPQSGAVGKVYVYDWNGTDWVETQHLQASDGDSGGFFGFSVAMEGSTAIIGRFWDNAAAQHAGSAYVFTRSGTTWTQQQKLLPTMAGKEDNFGWSVAISGSRIVVGASERFSSGNHDHQYGRAFVYTESAGTWAQTAVLAAATPIEKNQLGISVAIDGDRIVAGAWQDFFSVPQSGPGAAYVFDFNGTGWTQSQMLTASDPHVEDEFGSAVALQGDFLLVGASSHDAYPLWGAAYVFQRGPSGWSEIEKFLPDPSSSLAWEGNAVAIDGNYAVSGAFIDSTDEYQSGTSYVFGGFAPWHDLGSSLPGTNGAPVLAGTGTLCDGTPGGLVLTNARPMTRVTVIYGATRVDRPFKGGTLVPSADTVLRQYQTDASGSLELPDVFPVGLPRGTTYYFQVWIKDPAGARGWAASNAVSGTTP